MSKEKEHTFGISEANLIFVLEKHVKKIRQGYKIKSLSWIDDGKGKKLLIRCVEKDE